MPATYEINGPAIIWVGTLDEGDPERLGVPEGSVRVTYQRFHEPIITDVGGPRMPAAMQKFGMVAMVRFKLIAMDVAVLDKLRNLGDATAAGLLSSTGIMADDYGVPLWIDSRNGRPHKFGCAVLWEGEDELLGSRRTEDEMQFYCWTPIGPEADTALDGELWTYERPPGVP